MDTSDVECFGFRIECDAFRMQPSVLDDEGCVGMNDRRGDTFLKDKKVCKFLALFQAGEILNAFKRVR